jgi:probable rRNA maturation factor
MTNETRASIPRVRFSDMKDAALGTEYKLSLVFTTPARMQQLNKIYRNIDKPTDILSFPLSDTEGEIYISPTESRKEAKNFDRKYENFLAFLFIHGCVHLIGHDHSATMERIEADIRKKFKV